ncbi:MAG: transketolase [Propionibacteriaceae bacterium]|jgi:transketolase|nr:transketolase [Propionibacteriaceae bacterium]
MTTLSETELSQLRQTANRLRQHTVAMLAAAQSGHAAGPLGMAEIMTALYFSVMRHDPKRPDWSERDVFFLSNGHTAPVLYAALAEAGYFPLSELGSLRRFGSRLQGHPERGALPGLESTSGPLGEGLSQAAGYAYALKYLQAAPRRFCYVVMGDGELNEGNVWEAAMFASKYGLGQLIGLVDRNYIQIDGGTEQVMPLDDLAAKWRAFGWHTLEIDGNDVAQVVAACRAAQAVRSRPSVIIAHTVPGAGVDFMEYDYRWHGKAPNREEAEQALAQLSQEEARL